MLWEWYDCCQDDGCYIIQLEILTNDEWRRWFEDDGYDYRSINDLSLTNLVNFRVIDDSLTHLLTYRAKSRDAVASKNVRLCLDWIFMVI